MEASSETNGRCPQRRRSALASDRNIRDSVNDPAIILEERLLGKNQELFHPSVREDEFGILPDEASEFGPVAAGDVVSAVPKEDLRSEVQSVNVPGAVVASQPSHHIFRPPGTLRFAKGGRGQVLLRTDIGPSGVVGMPPEGQAVPQLVQQILIY